MARSKKSGLDYFSVDVNAVKEIKMMKIIHLGSGLKTVGFYFFMLSYIYEKGYYIHFTEDLCFLVSVQMKISIEETKALLNECLTFGLFDMNLYQNEGILTSEEIQRYYMRIINSCKRKAELEKYNLLNNNKISKNKKKTPQNEPDLFGNNPNNSEFIPNNTELIRINTEETENNSSKMPINSEESTRNIKGNTIYTTTTTTTNARSRDKQESMSEIEDDDCKPNRGKEGESSEQTTIHSEQIGNNLCEVGRKELFSELSDEWKQNVSGLYGLPREKLDEYLTKFQLYCHSIDKTHTEMNDLKRHFVSWLKKEVHSINEKQKSNEEQCIDGQSRQPRTARHSNYDLRRPAPVPVATAEDYKNSSF